MLFLGFYAVRVYVNLSDRPTEFPKLDPSRLLSFEEPSDPIGVVLKADLEARKKILFSIMVDKNPDALNQVIRELGALDVTQCPGDIRAAHANVVAQFRAFATESKELTDKVLNGSEPNIGKSVIAAVDNRRALLEAALHELTVLAANHGVRISK